jgi:hypothetical protein
MECGGNPDESGDTALDFFKLANNNGCFYVELQTKAPSPLRSAGALQGSSAPMNY